MRLTELRAAVAVADHLHFGRAATALGTSQSQLSQLVAALETGLGVRLFDRDTRNVALTAAGAEFVTECREVLGRLDATADRARAAGRGERGVLRIGTVGSALAAPLPRLLRAFREHHERVVVTLHQLPTAEQVDRLRSGEMDAAVVRPPLPGPDTADLVLTPLATEALVALLPPGHPLHGRARLRLGDLRDDGFVRNPRALGAGLHETVDAACRAAGFVPTTAAEVAAMDAVVALVAAGYGVALVPASVARSMPSGVHVAGLTPALPPVHLALVTRRSDLAPAVRGLVGLAAALGGPALHDQHG